MKIILERKNQDFHFEAKNESDHLIHIDASEQIGGSNKGMRPMQLLLAGLGGCSGIDIVNILKKQKQEISEFRIEVDGKRKKGEDFSPWEDIHLHFFLRGNIDSDKAQRALNLTMEKYCSIAQTLKMSGAKISTEITIL